MLFDILLEQHSCQLSRGCRHLLLRGKGDLQQHYTKPGQLRESLQLRFGMLDALRIWALGLLQGRQDRLELCHAAGHLR